MARRTFIDTANAARLLPKVEGLAEELGIGANADALAQVMGGYIVVSDTEPTETERNGRPVIWIDSTVTRDPGAWQAAAPTFQDTVGTYTIPQDEGALYLVDGSVKAAGTYSVTPPVSVTVTAQARAGYTLAGTTSWTHAFEPKPLDLAALGALITADAPSHYVTMKAGDYTDKGAAPLTWTAEAGVTSGAWGAKVAGPGAQVLSETKGGIGVLGGLDSFTLEFVASPSAASTMVRQQADLEVKTDKTVGYDSGFRTITYATATTLNRVAHWAVVLDAGTLTAYRNGISVGSVAFTQTRDMTYPLAVGYAGNAEIAHLAIYRSRALTAARIVEHAKAVTS